MTETAAAAHPTDPFDPQAINAADGLDPVDPRYGHVLRVVTALNMLPIAIGASVFDWLLIRHLEGPYGLITAAAWLIAIVMIISFPARRVQRWGYKIGEGQLRVARGWMFRTDTIVPFVRVQHIEIGRAHV